MKTASPQSPLHLAVAKLVEIIEEENGVLHQHRVISHAVFADRKNHALRELISAQRFETAPSSVQVCSPLLQRLAAALRINAHLLKLHIKAVGDISDIIVGSIREADSDGTYSRG
jgi:hypothetical protein